MFGCDHHGRGCSCDFCNSSPFSSMGRAAMGMGSEDGAAPYTPSVANRFLNLPNGPSGEWELAFGVPWSASAHRYLPQNFRDQARELLLCWQRQTELPAPVVQLVLAAMWEARLPEMILKEKGKGKCAQCGISGGAEFKSYRCSRCKSVFYCGRQCQKRHWQTHKATCRKKAEKTEK